MIDNKYIILFQFCSSDFLPFLRRRGSKVQIIRNAREGENGHGDRRMAPAAVWIYVDYL